MRLLVSVRSAAEVAAVVAGGADIVDAKEPSHGALGAVSAPVLRDIAHAVPPGMPLSVALGDPHDLPSLHGALDALEGLAPRPSDLSVKLGLAGARDLAAAQAMVAQAVRRAVVIVVAYADHAAAGCPPRGVVIRLAAAVGARGVLLDTHTKDGRDLFDLIGERDLRHWATEARRAGLLVALAGSLSTDAVRLAAGLPVDVIGVRGAACEGGRQGRVSEARVRALRSALDGLAPRPVAVG